MIRILYWLVWLALGCWLAAWALEGLAAADQRVSRLPVLSSTAQYGMPPFAVALLIGVGWGLMATFSWAWTPDPGKARRRRATAFAMGRLVESARTGVTINDVPQYDLYIRVGPGEGGEFIGRYRTLVPASEAALLRRGIPLPVRYNPANHDTVRLADLDDAAVQRAVIDWRVERGLLSAAHSRALRDGVETPASVMALRPTGRRRDGEVEMTLTLLMAPEDGAAWEAESTGFVDPDALSAIQVGSPVLAWYLPGAPFGPAVEVRR